MKTYNIKYTNYEALKLYVNNNNIIEYSNILVQVFSGIGKIKFIEEVIKNLRILIPKCKIIGATSSGEIFNGDIYEQECLISISVFEKALIKTISIKEEISDFQKGVKIANKLISSDTKVIISFGDTSIDGEKFLEGINSINKPIIVAGGIAGKCNLTDETYIFTEEGVVKNSIVAVALDSKELYVKNASSSNCIPIGKEHEITCVEKM